MQLGLFSLCSFRESNSCLIQERGKAPINFSAVKMSWFQAEYSVQFIQRLIKLTGNFSLGLRLLRAPFGGWQTNSVGVGSSF